MTEPSVAGLLRELGQAAAPGLPAPPPHSVGRLRAVTAALLAARPGAADEYRRFEALRRRTIAVPPPDMAGRTLLVTGGTGCVGTALLRELAGQCPGRVVSLADRPAATPVGGVEYIDADVRDAPTLDAIFGRIQPEIVLHLAAQRDPGQAELQPVPALATNVLGTRNVLAAAQRSGVRRFVYASTGKAMRTYTPDVYAGSKRLGEWLVAEVAARGRMACSGVRFTHVVDNSIIMRRLRSWSAAGEVIRLHAPDTMFYVQSARESAQLLLTALSAPPGDRFRLHLIRDLGWPVSLLDLALGAMAAAGTVAPLYLAGPDPGYERCAYPGLFDPRYAGEISPLINAIEAPAAQPSGCAEVDVVPMPRPDGEWLTNGLDDLERACRADDPAAARRAHLDLGRQALTAAAEATPAATLRRVTALTAPHRPAMTAEHRLIDDTFRAALAVPARVPVAAAG